MKREDYPPEDAPVPSGGFRVTDGNDDPGDAPFTWTCPWCGISEYSDSPGKPVGPFIFHPACYEECSTQMEADELETLIQQAEMVS